MGHILLGGERMMPGRAVAGAYDLPDLLVIGPAEHGLFLYNGAGAIIHPLNQVFI